MDNLEPLVDNNYRTTAVIIDNRVSPRKIVDNYDVRSSPGETAGNRNYRGSSGEQQIFWTLEVHLGERQAPGDHLGEHQANVQIVV